MAGKVSTFTIAFGSNVKAVAVEEGKGNLLRIAGAEDEGDHTLGYLSALVSQGVKVGQGQFSRFGLLLHVGGGFVAHDALQGVAGHDGQTGVARRRLLARLHDHAGSLQLDQRMMGLVLRHRHINHQTRGLFAVHELFLVDLPAETNEATRIAEDRGFGQVQRLDRLGISTVRVVPDHDTVVVDLPGDQTDQVLSNEAGAVRFAVVPILHSPMPLVFHLGSFHLQDTIAL